MVGRVFIVVKHSGEVVIGSRGFTEEEIKNGIVLVFNSAMNFSWNDHGISASLVFGTSPQKCFIPADDIVVIYSPELNAQFMTSPARPKEAAAEEAAPSKEKAEKIPRSAPDSKVVRVDFRKKPGKKPRKI